MTKQRYDDHSTEFGLWVRKMPDVDSYKGYRNYNLDIIWWKKEGYKEDPEKWMLIEEKRYMAQCKNDQKTTFSWLHKKIMKLKDDTYFGFHLLQFEKTSPEDGRIFWDNKEIDNNELLKILQFEFTHI